MRSLLLGTVIAMTFGIGQAWANCSYGGYTYSVGSTVCFDGWLQECTVAGYWKAIGMCKAPEAVPPMELAEELDRLLASIEREQPVGETAQPQ